MYAARRSVQHAARYGASVYAAGLPLPMAALPATAALASSYPLQSQRPFMSFVTRLAGRGKAKADPALSSEDGWPIRGTSEQLPFNMVRSEYGDTQPTLGERVSISARRCVANNLHWWLKWAIYAAAYGGVCWWFGEWINPLAPLTSSEGFMPSKNKKAASIPTTRLSDVCGCDEAKAEVLEVVEYLKGANRFTKLGGQMPKGLLLLGPPGTGKTLLARAVAGEAGVPFFSATGSDFEEMFVGVGARRMRDLFASAKAVSPSIIFIDEIDSVGGKRNAYDHPKARMSLNQLLSELDGFESNSGVIVIAATNYAERLDPALLRPGRFDRHLTVNLPNIKGRREILDLYANKLKLSPEIDLDVIARSTAGMSGADLSQLLNMAALRASTLSASAVTNAHVDFAKDKLLMGVERKSGVNDEDMRRHIAYYEGGRSLVASLNPVATPVHKVTIIERGAKLGHTAQVRTDDDDQVSQSYVQMLAEIDAALAGRASEELVYGSDGVTNHAQADLARAQRIGRSMVSLLGFNADIGPVSHSGYSARAVSNRQKEDVDAEVATLLNASYQRVKNTLKDNEARLHRVAQALLKHEVLDAAQIKSVLAGGDI